MDGKLLKIVLFFYFSEPSIRDVPIQKKVPPKEREKQLYSPTRIYEMTDHKVHFFLRCFSKFNVISDIFQIHKSTMKFLRKHFGE